MRCVWQLRSCPELAGLHQDRGILSQNASRCGAGRVDLTYVPVDCFTVDRRVAGLLPLTSRTAEPRDEVQMVQQSPHHSDLSFKRLPLNLLIADCPLPPKLSLGVPLRVLQRQNVLVKPTSCLLRHGRTDLSQAFEITWGTRERKPGL